METGSRSKAGSEIPLTAGNFRTGQRDGSFRRLVSKADRTVVDFEIPIYGDSYLE